MRWVPQSEPLSLLMLFGYPADIPKLKSIASPYKCIIIEYAFQAYGGKAGDEIIFKVPDSLRKQEILKTFHEARIRTTQLYGPITEHFCDIDFPHPLKYTMSTKDTTVNVRCKKNVRDVNLLIDILMSIT